LSPLPPAAARTFYAVADAWLPPAGPGRPGAGDVDLAPFAARALDAAGPVEGRRVVRFLRLLEQLPRAVPVLPAARHGFSWMERGDRLRVLELCARTRFGASRVAGLRRLVEDAWRSYSSPPGA
jgi:hypothetical protein